MKYVFIATVTLFCTALSAACGDRQPRSGVAVYLDESQPLEKRVEDALSRLTLEEKVGLLHAQSKFSSAGVPRLGIPEVVQLYIGDKLSSLPRPVKELKGFEKVHLAPGQSRTVTFEVDPGMLACYDDAKGGWGAEPGEFTAYVGAASDDIRGTVDFVLK